MCVNFVGYQLTWRMSQLPRVKNIINWWDTFASAPFAFDHRVWGSVGCGDAWGSRWRNWLFWTDFNGDFTLVVLVLYLFFLTWCSGQVFISVFLIFQCSYKHYQSTSSVFSSPEGSTDKGWIWPFLQLADTS